MLLSRAKWFALFVFLCAILTACNGTLPRTTAASPSGGSSAQVEFAGRVEAVNGNQWTVNGQIFQVNAQTQLDDLYIIGDEVQVSATVNADGSVDATLIRSLSPTPGPISSPEPTLSATQEQASSATEQPAGTATTTPLPVATTNPIQPSVGMSAPEFTGVVEAINGEQWTVGGQTFLVAPNAEFKGILSVGGLVKLHLIVNPDGTFSITAMEPALPGSNLGWDDSGSQVSDNSSVEKSKDKSGEVDQTKNEDENENEDEHGDENKKDDD